MASAVLTNHSSSAIIELMGRAARPPLNTKSETKSRDTRTRVWGWLVFSPMPRHWGCTTRIPIRFSTFSISLDGSRKVGDMPFSNIFIPMVDDGHTVDSIVRYPSLPLALSFSSAQATHAMIGLTGQQPMCAIVKACWAFLGPQGRLQLTWTISDSIVRRGRDFLHRQASENSLASDTNVLDEVSNWRELSKNALKLSVPKFTSTLTSLCSASTRQEENESMA